MGADSRPHGPSGDVKYAAIQEFGGAFPPHEIVPSKAKALAFVLGGKQVFAAQVTLPAVTKALMLAEHGDIAGGIASAR
jgi:hypothetical protein